MPLDRLQYTKYLSSFQTQAPVLNRPKISSVAKAYREKRIDLDDAERMVSLLASRNAKAKERGAEVYKHFTDRGLVGLKEKLTRKKETQKTFTVKAILFTTPEKRNTDHIDMEDQERYNRYNKYLNRKKYKDKYVIYSVDDLHVTGTTAKYLHKTVEQLIEREREEARRGRTCIGFACRTWTLRTEKP